jgi:chromosome segregation ATPase
MVVKKELQNTLKDKYGINKNISDVLDREECEQLLQILESEPSAVKLVESYAQKNASLGNNNAYYSRMRNQAERKLEDTKAEYDKLHDSITKLENKKKELEQNRQKLEAEMQNIILGNEQLADKVETLKLKNEGLTKVNDDLKQENRSLKNIIDSIRLKLAQDTHELLQLDNSEIKAALVKLFKWTLG